ncbi:MAG TPA: DNA repair protein RadC [Candidatus Paceibacterota bacterium]|nr:DNA repair protein RadC [Candidatus Paceibacterota bacterium]
MNTRYRIRDNVAVLDNPERRYVIALRDLPDDEKPRERLLAAGPRSLTTAELLAVVFGNGTKKEGVLEMSARIMKDYGERSIMRQANAKKLAEDLDIPIVKALQVVAVAELGRRFHARNDLAVPTLRTAKEVYEYAIDMRALPKEHLRGLYLNNHYKVVRDEVISIGTVDMNIVHPREVFRPALEYAAAAVILVHNHPSGNVEPSEADIAVTAQLIEAGALLGIDVIDHVIVTRGGFKSVAGPYRC